IGLVVITAFLVQQDIPDILIFSKEAFFYALIIHLIIINFVTFMAYYYDKSAAKKNAWRISEKTLHAFAFVGGTPATFLSQKKLRHKTKKEGFQSTSWLILIIQIALLVGLGMYL